MTEFDDNFEYEANPSAEPISRGKAKVRIRKITPTPSLEKEGD